MNQQTLPKVSCLMRAYNWDTYTPEAISYFLQQDYDNKELIIFDSSNGVGFFKLKREGLLEDERIRYVRLQFNKPTNNIKFYEQMSEKRRICENLASGEYLMTWNDDDISFPDRITESVKAIQGFDAAIINDAYFYYNGEYYLYPMGRYNKHYFHEVSAIYKASIINKINRNRNYHLMQHSFNNIAVGNIGKNDIFVARIAVDIDDTLNTKRIIDNLISIGPTKFNRQIII